MGAAGVCQRPEPALLGCATLNSCTIPTKHRPAGAEWAGLRNHPMDLGSDYLKAIVLHQEELDRKIREQHQQLVKDLGQYLAQERKRLKSID